MSRRDRLPLWERWAPPWWLIALVWVAALVLALAVSLGALRG